MLSVEDVFGAAQRSQGVAVRTPVLTSRTLDDLVGASVFLKAECFQRAGAFKFRGAYNALSMLDRAERARGVFSASSGNHAQAVALSGQLLSIQVTVLMPQDAPAAKVSATKGYGAKIVFFDRYREDRDALQRQLGEQGGHVIVPAYDYYPVMAGQGTTALEVSEQVPRLDAFLVPVSGGGLAAGCATYLKTVRPGVQVFGVEPEAADDTRRSLEAGARVEPKVPETIADGLQAPTPGALTFEINRRLLDGVLVASEAEIVEAMRFMLERQKLLIEPSGAVALAALIRNREQFQGKRVAVVLSGGNVDLGRLCRLLDCRSEAEGPPKGK